MKISLNWIKDYVNLENIDPKELALKLTMSTAEVEEVIIKGNDIDGVVVGKVLTVTAHPSSEKLKIVTVDIGTETVQSVCGAPNVAEGILVPFAKLGGRILKVPRIEKNMLAGIESNGILCSGAEIDVNGCSDKLLILDNSLKPGTDLKELYGINDVIIEIDNKSLTHRPDLWGHYGIAREIAAILKRPLLPLKRETLNHNPALPTLKIEIENKDKCPRYSGITVENVPPLETPLEIQVRLHYCDMNTRSLLVDLSNYIMLDIGQPNHAFDHRFAKNIVVKFPPQPITFRTLDGVDRQIGTDVLMIYNEETPVAVAGVIGGEDSEITATTTSLFLESANFDAFTIRSGAVKIGARTDASARFEKSLDPALTTIAIERFIYLLRLAHPDIKITSNLSDLYLKPPKAITVQLDKAYLDRTIGKTLPAETITGILSALEFKVQHVDGQFTVDVPQFRATRDISMKIDLVEEVTRIYGYDNIEPQTVEVPLKPLDYNENRLIEHKIKELLAEKFGFSEVHSHTWYDNDFNKRMEIESAGEIQLVNPHAQEMNNLRTSIVPVMLQFAEKNVNQFPVIPLFEIGKVFYLDQAKNQCDERKHLCILLGDKTQNEDVLFYQLKGIITHIIKLLKNTSITFMPVPQSLAYPWIHPEKSAVICIGEQTIGYLSVLHPTVRRNIDKKLNIAILEVNFNQIFAVVEQPTLYKEISKFPEVSLDFSFLADRTVPYELMNQHVAQFNHSLLLGYRYVTMYEGKNLPDGKKSITFSFTLGSREKTLLSEDIDLFLKQLIAHMEQQGFVLRQG